MKSRDDDSIVCVSCGAVQLSFMAAISLLQPHRTILDWISYDISTRHINKCPRIKKI